MQEKTKKIVTILMLLLALIGSAFAVAFAMKQESNGLFWAAYWLTLVMAVVSLAFILWFACVKLAKNFKENPKAAKKTLIMFGLIVVVAVVSFLLASSTDVSQTTMDKYNVTEGASKWVGTGMNITYVLIFAAAIAIIYVECAKFFKKK